MNTQDALALAQKAFGFVPNLMTEMATQNPAVAAAYLAASQALSQGVLTPIEHQVVMLAASAHNQCHYCSAAHRTAAIMMGAGEQDVAAIDALELPGEGRFATLALATWAVQKRGGWVKAHELDLTQSELYEVIALVGLKTITNFINHIAATPIDPPFQAQAKRQPKAAA